MATKKEMTFQQAMERLEEIVGLLEEGSRPLEESIALYQEGGQLMKLCEEKLADARLQIEKLEMGEGE